MQLPIHKYGKTERHKFGKINEVIDIPDLVEIQKSSYEHFINEDITEILDDISPVIDYSDRYELYFKEPKFKDSPNNEKIKDQIKFDEKLCREKDGTYARPLMVTVELHNRETGEVLSKEIYMCDMPKMTDSGSFIINGAERVVVSQIVRSPGSYNTCTIASDGKKYYQTTVNPAKGSYLLLEQEKDGTISLKVDKKSTGKRKMPVTVFLRALGNGSDNSIREIFDTVDKDGTVVHDRMIENTLEKDDTKSEIAGLNKFYACVKSGETSPNENSIRQFIISTFFENKYDLARVGRYKYNKKFGLAYRLAGCTIEQDVVAYKSLDSSIGYKLGNDAYSMETGEIIARKGEVITAEIASTLKSEGTYGASVVLASANEVISPKKALEIQNAGVGSVNVIAKYADRELAQKYGDVVHKIISNNTVDFKAITGKNHTTYDMIPTMHYPNYVLAKEIAESCEDMSIEDVAVKYQDAINELYHWVEMDDELNEKPEDVKNRDKRTVARERFVKSCKSFFEYLNSDKEEYTLEERIAMKKEIKLCVAQLNHKTLTIDDVIASISTIIGLQYGIGTADNIDHLSNRRVRSVGELLYNQFRLGMNRLEKVIRERMSSQDAKDITPVSLVNTRPISAVIREFFGSSQLSQFMDQTNPAAELTHKRKLSALGPGGITRERATYQVRDVHHTHYGRICPIETPEGQNIGLISSLATFAKVDEFGFIMSPYRKIEKDENGIPTVTDKVEYLPADIEDKYTVAQANEPLDENNHFIHKRVGCRQKDLITQLEPSKMDYMDVSPKQLVSVATALIPFLENDDTNRALMGSNMQRQAVPLMKTQAAMVATGIEAAIARDSGVLVTAKHSGYIKSVSSELIELSYIDEDGLPRVDKYPLKKFERSNQCTCLNQRPIVNTGDKVQKGEIIADGPSTDNGELALGKNILIGYMEWEGYNYEDAILISEKLVQDDVFTSIHIEEYETEARDTKLGAEEITRDIPNVGADLLKELDADGIIRVGAEVHPGDYLVGKLSPKGEIDMAVEDKLLRAIYGDKSRDVKDTSLKVPHGESGIVVGVKVFTRNEADLKPGVNKLVRVYIAQKRKIQVGDKMAGRHGNKGVISRVLPQADMPFLEDGTPLEIVLNPLGVPSRMNIGQVLEVHLGYMCKLLGWKIATPVFDGATENDIEQLFREQGVVNAAGNVDGKVKVYDGRTGEPFENRVTVGVQYMIKLIHLVDDKIHARSNGPYSYVTQQPLGGKAQFGGQRFGEMEVWALEAYGAAHVLQEILTVKSDDVKGRRSVYKSIIEGTNIAEPGIPEAFKVLIKEMQSLALDVKILTNDGEEMVIRELDEDETQLTAQERKEIEREKRKKEEEVNILDEDITTEDNDIDEDIFETDDDDDTFDDGLFDDDDTFGDDMDYDDEDLDKFTLFDDSDDND